MPRGFGRQLSLLEMQPESRSLHVAQLGSYFDIPEVPCLHKAQPNKDTISKRVANSLFNQPNQDIFNDSPAFFIYHQFCQTLVDYGVLIALLQQLLGIIRLTFPLIIFHYL